MRARHADGSWRLLDIALLTAPSGGPVRGQRHPALRDITDEAVWSARDAGRRAGAVPSLAESLPLGILSADARGWVVFCNEAAQQIFNLPGDGLMGHGWERLVDPGDLPEVMDAVRNVVALGLPQQVMFRIQTGLFVRWALAKFVPLGGADQVTGWIATVDDVTDRRRAESELTHQATHDALTGLPNRMLLEDRLQQACARLRRDHDEVSVMFIDLDDFKLVNDTYGHNVGDQVLVEVANRLHQILRAVDTVARLGGDEFVVFCESLPESEVARGRAPHPRHDRRARCWWAASRSGSAPASASRPRGTDRSASTSSWPAPTRPCTGRSARTSWLCPPVGRVAVSYGRRSLPADGFAIWVTPVERLRSAPPRAQSAERPSDGFASRVRSVPADEIRQSRSVPRCQWSATARCGTCGSSSCSSG